MARKMLRLRTAPSAIRCRQLQLLVERDETLGVDLELDRYEAFRVPPRISELDAGELVPWGKPLCHHRRYDLIRRADFPSPRPTALKRAALPRGRAALPREDAFCELMAAFDLPIRNKILKSSYCSIVTGSLQCIAYFSSRSHLKRTD